MKQRFICDTSAHYVSNILSLQFIEAKIFDSKQLLLKCYIHSSFAFCILFGHNLYIFFPVVRLFLESLQYRNPDVLEAVTLPCLQIINSCIKGSAESNKKVGVVFFRDVIDVRDIFLESLFIDYSISCSYTLILFARRLGNIRKKSGNIRIRGVFRTLSNI